MFKILEYKIRQKIYTSSLEDWYSLFMNILYVLYLIIRRFDYNDRIGKVWNEFEDIGNLETFGSF